MSTSTRRRTEKRSEVVELAAAVIGALERATEIHVAHRAVGEIGHVLGILDGVERRDVTVKDAVRRLDALFPAGTGTEAVG